MPNLALTSQSFFTGIMRLILSFIYILWNKAVSLVIKSNTDLQSSNSFAMLLARNRDAVIL